MIELQFPRKIKSEHSVRKRRQWLDEFISVPERKKPMHYHEYFNKEVVPSLLKDGSFVLIENAKTGLNLCHTYAFRYNLSEQDLEDISVSELFEKKLGQAYRERNLSENPQEDDLVIYGERHQKIDRYHLKHSALFIKDELVKSKWGGGGILKHRIWDVPQKYGDYLSFFCKNTSTII